MAKSKKSGSKAKRYGNPAKRAQALVKEKARRPIVSAQEVENVFGWGGAELAQPSWLAPAVAEVLDDAPSLLTATSPRELLTSVGRQLGGVFRRLINSDALYLDFNRFHVAVAAAAAEEVAVARKEQRDWRPAHRLLYGLVATAPYEVLDDVAGHLREVVDLLGGELVDEQFQGVPAVEATGRFWELVDVYGGARRGLVAEIQIDGEMSCFAWDVDMCDMVSHVNAGLFTAPDSAADAWRDWVGEQGVRVELRPVETVDRDLLWKESLVMFRGNETRTHLDSWQLLRRAATCVGQVMPDTAEETGDEPWWIPAMKAEYAAFAAWFESETGAPLTEGQTLDAETVSEQWCSLTPEHSWGVVSPHRAERLVQGLKEEYVEEVLPGLLAMAPLWVRFEAERGPTPPHLVERVLAVASGTARREPYDCPGLPQ